LGLWRLAAYFSLLLVQLVYTVCLTASHAIAKMALMGQEVPVDKNNVPAIHKDLLENSQRQYSERAKRLKHK